MSVSQNIVMDLYNIISTDIESLRFIVFMLKGKGYGLIHTLKVHEFNFTSIY